MTGPASGLDPFRAGSEEAADDAGPLTAIQRALGVVARRARDIELHQAIGARVGHRLDGPYHGTLSRLGLAGECTVTELSELLGLELSTVSRRVKALEEKGLVERRTHPDDRRTSLLRLTDDGRAVFTTLSAGWRAMLSEVLTDWDPSDIDVFAERFERFADSLERYAAQQTAPPRSALADHASDPPPERDGPARALASVPARRR